MNIEYVNHSLGNNFGDTIELNKHLKDYPKLHRQILNHELKHTNKRFTKQDLILDLTDNPVNKRELILVSNNGYSGLIKANGVVAIQSPSNTTTIIKNYAISNLYFLTNWKYNPISSLFNSYLSEGESASSVSSNVQSIKDKYFNGIFFKLISSN
jgi:hypothetical protein